MSTQRATFTAGPGRCTASAPLVPVPLGNGPWFGPGKGPGVSFGPGLTV